MQDIGHGVVQIAALFARYPWQSFAVVMAAVLAMLVGDRPRRTTADFDFFSAFDGDGGGGDGG